MRPAVCATFAPGISVVQALPLIRQAGFEAVSLTAEPWEMCTYLTEDGRKTLRGLLEENRLAVDSLHAPYPRADRLFSLYDADRQEAVRLCKLAIDAAAELGAAAVVIHLIQPYDIPEGHARRMMVEAGRGSVSLLASHAARKGVKLALENGQEASYDEVVGRFLEEFGGDAVGLCYDTGHENVQGRCFSFLEQYGRYLTVLHIHDNEGTDSHLLPYEGNIDWKRFRQVLAATGYKGYLHLEASTRRSAFKEPAVFLSEARKRLDKIDRGG